MSRLIALLMLLPAMCSAASVECPAPVSDIPAKVEELRKQDRDTRYKYLNCLTSHYADVKDLALLRNLKQLGLAVRKMMEELKLTVDDDYDYREAIDVADKAIIALSRASAVPVADLIDNYKQLYHGNSRFKLLEYWRKRVEKISDLPTLIALQDFSLAARQFSEKQEKTEDEREYISREAEYLQRDASARFLILSPAFEGVYDVTITCAKGKCTELPRRLRFVVMNTLGNEGIVVSLVNPKDGAVYFLCPLTVVTQGGRVLEGATKSEYTPSRIPGQFAVKLDLETGVLTGELRETLSTGYFHLEGPLLWSTSTYFFDAAPAPVTAQSLTGEYKGDLVGEDGDRVHGTLIVRHLTQLKDRYAGTFRSPYDILGFQNGNVSTTRATVNLVDQFSGNHYIRWALAWRDGKLVGRGFSTSVGRLFSLELEKTGDIVNGEAR